jgi:type II secretory pathway component PulF
MEQDLNKEIAELKTKLDAVYASVEKTRKYFLWNTIITIAFFVVPLIALAFVIPAFIGTYTQQLQDLGL